MQKRLFKVIIHKKITGILFLSLAVVLMASLAITSHCEAKAKKEQENRPPTAEELKELAKEAKDELNGTTWEITLREMAAEEAGNKKRKEMKDTLTFADMRIGSKEMKDEGFGPTNYSIRIKGKDNEIVVWETMQTSEGKGIAFWRGETKRGTDTMRGVLSWHISDTNKEDYSFSGIKKEEAPAAVPVVEESGEELGEISEEEPGDLAAVEAANATPQPVVEVPKATAPIVAEKAPKVEKKEEPKKNKNWWKK